MQGIKTIRLRPKARGWDSGWQWRYQTGKAVYYALRAGVRGEAFVDSGKWRERLTRLLDSNAEEGLTKRLVVD